MKIRFLPILPVSVLALSLSSCQYFGDSGSGSQHAQNNNVYDYPPIPYQPEGAALSSEASPPRPKPVTIPKSYYLASGTPVAHDTIDEDWVSGQSPNGYTIQLANDEKPSVVAKTLANTPKNARTAQVRYQKDNQTLYMGIYGSYVDKAAAEAALNKLPPDIKEKASIEPWSKVQEETQPVKDPNTPESTLPAVPDAPTDTNE